MDGMDDKPSSMIPGFAHGLHILLVDHDTTSLMHIASMLEQYSYKVTTTERASVALSMIQKEKDQFRLVMANVDMPDIDSLSFLRALVKMNIPLILMASERNVKVACKALAEGASHYLEKPVSMDDLKYLWQYVYRKKKYPMKRNRKAHHGMKVNCGRKESQAMKIKGPICLPQNVATGNNLQGIDHQHMINDPKGKNTQIAVEGGCLDQLMINDPKGKNKQTVVEGCLNDPKGKNKHIVVEGCLNDHPKEKGKETVVEGCLNEENCVNESQITFIKEMMTKGSQKQGGSIIERSNEEKEGNGNEKQMNINSEQINSNTENTIVEEGKEWKDWKENSIFLRPPRRARIIWNTDLHLKFTAAVSALGDKNARPKSILQLMNVPNLTQRQIASHLQKYKAHVKRLCETATSSLQSMNDPANIFSKIGSSPTLQNHSSVVSRAAYGSSSIVVGGNIPPNSLSSFRLHAINYANHDLSTRNHNSGSVSLPRNSTQHAQSYHFNIPNAVQMGNFESINKHENRIEKQPLQLETGNVHMSTLDIPSMTQEAASRNVSVETFQFPNVPNDVHEEQNFTPVLAAPSGSHNWNKVSMTSSGTIGGLNIVPGSGNVANADKVPSEFTYGNQKVDATESSTPLQCSLNQSQPLSKYTDLLKELEKGVELKNAGGEVDQGDVDRFCEWLTDGLFGDSTNPEYFVPDGANH